MARETYETRWVHPTAPHVTYLDAAQQWETTHLATQHEIRRHRPASLHRWSAEERETGLHTTSHHFTPLHTTPHHSTPLHTTSHRTAAQQHGTRHGTTPYHHIYSGQDTRPHHHICGAISDSRLVLSLTASCRLVSSYVMCDAMGCAHVRGTSSCFNDATLRYGIAWP